MANMRVLAMIRTVGKHTLPCGIRIEVHDNGEDNKSFDYTHLAKCPECNVVVLQQQRINPNFRVKLDKILMRGFTRENQERFFKGLNRHWQNYTVLSSGGLDALYAKETLRWDDVEKKYEDEDTNEDVEEGPTVIHRELPADFEEYTVVRGMECIREKDPTMYDAYVKVAREHGVSVTVNAWKINVLANSYYDEQTRSKRR